jgi:endo-1,4-beta-xylanase
MDVRMRLPEDAAKLTTQASTYADMLTVCVSAPNCTTFVLWGFTDKYSWVPGTFPGYGSALIFDEVYEPKLAYYAMSDVLKASE